MGNQAFRDQAAKAMGDLNAPAKTAIQARFSKPEDMSKLIDDVAKGMAGKVAFPQALLAAVRAKDPALARSIEKDVSPGKPAPAKAAPKAPKPKEEAPAAPTVSAEVSAGSKNRAAAVETKAGVEAETKGGYTLSADAGVVSVKGSGTTFTGSASIETPSGVAVAIGRAPLYNADAYVNAYMPGVSGKVGKGEVSVGGQVEVGTDTGAGYGALGSVISYQAGRVTIDASPTLFVAGRTVTAGGGLGVSYTASGGKGGYGAVNVGTGVFTDSFGAAKKEGRYTAVATTSISF